MRRVAALMLVLAACSGEREIAPDGAAVPRPDAAPPRTVRTAPESRSATDTAETAETRAGEDLLTELALADRRVAAADALHKLDDDARAAVLDAGVRHPDALVARTAATLVRASRVSAAMRPLIARLLVDDALDPAFRDVNGERVALDAFAPFGDARTLEEFLDRLNAGAPVAAGAECGYALALAGKEHLESADRLAASGSTGGARLGAEIAAHVRACADPALHGDVAADPPPTRAAALAALAALPEGVCPFIVSDRGEVTGRDAGLLTLLETGARDEFLARIRPGPRRRTRPAPRTTS